MLARTDALICGCIDIGSNTTRLLVARGGQGVAARADDRAGVHPHRQGGTQGRRDPAGEDRGDGGGGAAPGARRARAGAPPRSWPWPPRPSARRRTATSSARAVEEAIGQPLKILAGDEEARLSFVGAARTLATPATGHDGGGGRGRRVHRDRHRIARRQRGLVGVVSDRVGLSRGQLPALGSTVGRGAAGRARPRDRRVRGTRGAAGRDRRGRGRHGHVAAAAGGRRAGPRDARAGRARALADPDRARSPSASSSTPSGCGCCPPASSCWRPSRTASGCRCASPGEGCARA